MNTFGIHRLFQLPKHATPDATGGDPFERNQIEDRFKWNLELIFPDWDAWEKSFTELETMLPDLAAHQGTLDRSGQDLLAAIEAMHSAQRLLEKTYVYAGMKSDEDTRIGENTGRKGRIGSLAVGFNEAVSWFDAEVLAIEPKRLTELRREEAQLAQYDHFIDNIQRAREHTLPAEQEALLAAAGLMSRGASQVFNALDNADLDFGRLEDENGRSVALTKGRYYKVMKGTDRRVREEAFGKFLSAYGSVKNTLAANMDANVKNHVFFAKARRYAGTLESSLHPDNVPTAVFHSLIETVSDNIEVIHRYTALKKRVLGLDPLKEHDLMVPLFPEGEFRFSYDEACAVVLESCEPLGTDYVDTVRRGINGGWIDVHETAGKRSGAYSNGVYDTQPYILLNWADQLGDTFTFTHELGHSMHSYLAVQNQPYVYGSYPIFTAEVASTFNELLLMDHLLKKDGDKRRKLFLLDHHLAQINNTVFRQTMFAEFEHRIHRMGETGETLTADNLGELYQEILVKYWGPEVQFHPDLSRLTWARIPHFFYNYYVYQYATAYSAAVALSRKVLGGGEKEREQYLSILRSGCSRYPVETIGLGGVDMASSGPVTDVVKLFASLLDEVERLLDAIDARP